MEPEQLVKKGDIHAIPVTGHETQLCPHCGNEEIESRNDHHYLPYFTLLCRSEGCRMETSYEIVYQVCEEPKKTLPPSEATRNE